MHFCSELVVTPNDPTTIPPPKRNKISVTYVNSANNKVTKTIIQPENWIDQLEESEECSPICSQEDHPMTRFPWKKASPPPPPVNVEDKWTPPKISTMPYFIFKAVKEHLQYDGPDHLMKSSPAMMELLDSGTILQVMKEGRKMSYVGKKQRKKKQITTKNTENTKNLDVKFANGRIGWTIGTSGHHICKEGNCWKMSANNGKCSSHADSLLTHFLMRDTANSTPTYILVSSRPHSPKKIHTEATILNFMTSSPSHCRAEFKYGESRKSSKENWTPKWKLVTKKPWVVEYNKSTTFEQTIRVVLAILAMRNAEESDPTKKLVLIKEQLFIHKVDWSVVKKMLTSMGVTMEFGESSDYGKMKESPLLKIADLKWRDGDSWNYFKYGTIGKIYVGIVTQMTQKPMPTSFINTTRHHSDDKGIPIFQCQSENEEFNNKENNMMEGVGQMAVILCEMLGGIIDDIPIKIDFDKLENNSNWEKRHLNNMKTLVEFFSSRKLNVTFPEILNVEEINWRIIEELVEIAPEEVLSQTQYDLFRF